jgi:hypothetical protein
MSCTEPTLCSPAGSWGWEGNRNPGGSNIEMVLAVTGDSVRGSGYGIGIGPRAEQDSLAVTGHRDSGDIFALAITYRSGRRVSYSATLFCPDTLRGTAIESGVAPYTLVFWRGN